MDVKFITVTRWQSIFQRQSSLCKDLRCDVFRGWGKLRGWCGRVRLPTEASEAVKTTGMWILSRRQGESCQTGGW